jgi:hypothetical protein
MNAVNRCVGSVRALNGRRKVKEMSGASKPKYMGHAPGVGTKDLAFNTLALGRIKSLAEEAVRKGSRKRDRAR